MRRSSIAIGWLVVALGIAALGCENSLAEPKVNAPPDATGADVRPANVKATAEEQSLAVTVNNAFAADVYQRLAAEHPNENLFFSPFSVSTSLLMATEGASGETADQMAKVLHAPKNLRSGDPDSSYFFWKLAPIHQGLAAIAYRLSPEPNSPELLEKIAELRSKIKALESKAVGQSDDAKTEVDRVESRTTQVATNKLIDELNTLFKQTKPYEWSTANALWVEKTFSFRKSFLDTIQTSCNGAALPIDFRSNPEGARRQINDWVAQQTRQRIQDLLGPDSLSAKTRLVITNAAYFKGEWSKPFETSSTSPVNFHLAGGTTVSVPMMTGYLSDSEGYGAFKSDGAVFNTPREIPVDMKDNDPSLYPDAHGFTALRLPYKGDKLFMAIVVPQSANGLGELEKQLSIQGLRHWTAAIPTRPVIANVPKFKLATEYSLKESLVALGMQRAFTDPSLPKGAEFDRMTSSGDPADRLFISAVRHKAFLEVNENGTEAAAATAVELTLGKDADSTDLPKTRPFIPTFTADKPFLFAICDRETQSVLFLGRVVKPESP